MIIKEEPLMPELVRLNVEVDPDLLRRLKVRAAEKHTTVRAIVTAAVERHLARKAKKGGPR